MSHANFPNRTPSRKQVAQRRMAGLAIITILSLLISLFPQVIGAPVPMASAHNLQTRMVSMFLDPTTQTMLDGRMAAPGWTPPDPLLQPGDEIGLIIKVIPRDGTTTGVGGHVDFYVPSGADVIDVGYMIPDGSGGFVKAPMKGQSPIAVGDGPIGAKATTQLIDPTGWTGYTNINGVTQTPVVPGSGLHRGTIAGVYGDTGIFYSTDPDTAYGSWQTFTGDSTANGCGSLAYNPTVLGKTLVNNSGDTIVPCNKWDAEQEMAWGVKGGTYGASAPIVDYGDGRGNAPWGFAAGTAGPQSGYAWYFDWDQWRTSGKTAADMRAAMANTKIGPWNRIKYPGSRISKDQAGLISTVLGYASVDGSNVGYAVSSGAPLPSNTNAIRWAVGQLTSMRPEYVWVKLRLNSITEITDPSGCPVFKGDTFGGDAGGTDNGKDHLWRYYEPTEVRWNGCLAAQKPATKEFVKVGDTYQYKLKVYNLQAFTLSSVVVRDTLPSGVTFVSAFPSQGSGPSPLVWNVGALLPGQKWEATVTVKASGTGYLDNVMTVDSAQLPTQTVLETTESGAIVYLVPSKTATPTSVAPGATVTYDVLVKNIGTGPTGNPVVVKDFLPGGLTFNGAFAPVVYVNGALITPVLTTSDPANPVITVPAAINGGSQMTIKFQATVPANADPGVYCNAYSVTQNGVPITTGSEACITVGGGKIGDTIFRDWNGNGAQDAGEEGLAGATVTLTGPNCTPCTAVTDANGAYLFSGLTGGTYTVTAPTPGSGGVPSGYTVTADPDGAPYTTTFAKVLATDEVYLGADWGYRPGGAGAIGDKVFEDIGNDGYFNAGDAGIPNVTVWLYEDSDGDGVITPGVDARVATTQSNASGDYAFTNLAEGVSYLVKVDKTDPDIQGYFNTKYGSGTAYQISTLEVSPSPNLAGSDLDNDFGFWRAQPGSIGDQVFIDKNADGAYNAGDVVLPNVTVSLYQDTNGNGVLDAGEPLLKTTSTDVNGQYTFGSLGPGKYIVDVDQNDPDLPGGLSATKDLLAATLTAGQNRTDIDFPFVSVLTKSVDKASANPGDTLTFTINPYYPGPSLLSSTLVQDVVPAGTTFASAGQGGQLSPYDPQPATQGQVTTLTTGQGIYSINSNTPQYRNWDGSTFGAQTASVNLQDTPMVLVGAASPTRNEKIVVDIVNNNPEVQAMRWNGTAWAALPIPPATTTAGALANLASNMRTLWGGAVAYEQLSGDAVLVWNNTTVNGTNRLTWNVWNGTAWGANTDISATGEPQQMRIAARPNSDEMALVTSDSLAYDRVRVWNGSAWSAPQDLDVASGGSQTAIGVAYEQQSGDALVVYGKAVATDVKLYYRTYSGGVWSAEQSLDPTALGVTTGPQWVSIAADPNSDRIVVGVVTNGGKTWLDVWDGAAWGDSELAATSLTNTALNVGVAFETMSGQAMAVYGELGLTTVGYETWTADAGWSGPQTGPDMGSTVYPNVIALSPSPNSDRMMLSTNDSNSDAKYTLWDGDAWGAPTVASTNTGSALNQPVLFLWDRQQPPSSTTDLTASPTSVVNGGTFTVQMTLRATKRVTSVTPGALTITNLTGNGATATCGSPSPASQTVPANVPTVFTWTCTGVSAATMAELNFTAGASGTYSGVPGGSYNFASGASNSTQLLALGDRGTVTWDLGANTARIDGVSSDAGAALCPVQVDLNPIADTYIAKGNPTNWYGLTNPVITRPANASSLKYALFKFDLSSLAGKQIKSSELALYVTGNRSSAHYDQVYRMVTPWTEGTSAADGATWNDPNGAGAAGAWASAGGAFGANDYHGATMYSMIGPETNGFYQYADIRVLVDAWVNGGVTNNGLVLISTGADGGDGKYASRESTTTPPVLRVTTLVSTPGGCNSGNPVTTVLDSKGDAYLDKANPAVNYGQATTLLTRPADATKLKYTLLWFDGDEIPPGATINSAVLDLYVDTNKSNHVDDVRVMTQPWYEAAVTWNDNDATGAGSWPGGAFGSSSYSATSLGVITPDSKVHKTLSVTGAVDDWANNGVLDRGLVLISTGTDTGDAKYGSREYNTAANRPKITVNWTLAGNPGPTTTVSLSATPMLASSTPTRVKVVMTVSGSGSFTSFTAVAPADLAVNSGGLTTTKFSGPSPASATVSAGSPATFTYEYDVTPGSLPASVAFRGKPTATGAIFVAGRSNSVLITPPLTYQVTVNNPAGVNVVENTATIQAKEPDIKLTSDVCYAIADWKTANTSNADILVKWTRDTGAIADVGAGTGTVNAEAAVMSPDQTVIYTTDRDPSQATAAPESSDRFGKVDLTTGLYTAIGRVVNSTNPLSGALGNFTVADVDGLAFDPITGKLYAVGRREATNTQLDFLFQINPVTGFHVDSAFGAGVDYVVLRTDLLPTPLYDVDDLAFDPITGALYAVANTTATSSGAGDRLIKINKTSGALSDVGRITDATTGLPQDDMEALSFLGDGTLYGTTGSPPPANANPNSLWKIDPVTAVATKLSAFPAHDDYEALACKDGLVQTGATVIPPTSSNTTETALTASIGDYVWDDTDGDGVQDPGEPPLAGVQVCATNGTTTLCDTTDGSGHYRIFGLGAGAWTVTLDLSSTPAGYQPTTPTSLSVTLAANQQYNDADFGLRPPGTASIGDTVWLDANANGAVDPGESGLPFVTVKLYKDTNNNGVVDAGDVLFGATTTDANGQYLFPGLYGGDYLVVVDTNSPVTSPYGGAYTIASALTPVFGANPRDVTLSDGQAVTTADFGYNWGGTIGDYVWWDNDRNGAQNESPATPIAGAAVLLYFDANNNGVLDPAEGDYQIGYTSTDANGLYHFYNLPPGPYLVDVYEDSFNPLPGVRETVPTTPNVQVVNLGPKQTVNTADFGYYVGAKVEGNVFWDADRNGLFDGSETGLTPVTVSLTGTDMFGNPVTATTSTDAAGHFSFVVPEGNYTLSYNSTQTTGLGYPDATTPLTYTFHAFPGEDWHPVFDFGVDHSGVIGDRVWNDTNGNGIQDAGEPGISGVTVNLYASDGTTWLATTATDASGLYHFLGLPDGAYTVKVTTGTLPAGYSPTGEGDPGAACGAGCDNTITASVSGGGTNNTVDFGYRYTGGGGASPFGISGWVWGDANGNGVFEPGLGELPISGVKVTFACGAYGTYVVTTASSVGSNYSLGNVPTGTTCTISVDPTTLPSTAYTQTGDPDSVCPGTGCNSQTTATVTNANITDRNFGYREILGSISGTVCSATDGDGLCQTGEPGLTPVTVTLIYAGRDGILGTSDDVSTPTTTDAGGNYTFPGLAPGLYQVVEANPANYTSLADRDGGNPDNISVVLALGQNAVDQDFEDHSVAGGFIGDRVWWDVNKDGRQDAGEPGIPGVTVELLQNNVVIAATTTDANGLYSFTNLADGAYVVRIQGAEFSAGGTLAIWTASPQNAGGVPDNLDSDGDPTAHTAAVTLTGGAGTADTDFGFHVSASYQVSKKLTSLNPARLGQEITFSITITNTGNTWISVLPLQDTYDTTYLTYSFATHFATPDTDDHVNDGVLTWSDLTAAAPKGFGADLAPGETRVVQISFTARSDTSTLSNRRTVNTVTVTNAAADPDGPTGPLGALAPLPPATSNDGVSIFTPTGVTFESFDVVVDADSVLVNWRTASEAAIVGFNVLRLAEGSADGFAAVNSELILAAHPGEEAGDAYSLRDSGLAPGVYTYTLQFVRLDGAVEDYGSVRVTIP